MAPKKHQGNVVVRTTRRVVKETVQVAVVETDGREEAAAVAAAAAEQEAETVTPAKEIVVEDKREEKQEEEDQETVQEEVELPEQGQARNGKQKAVQEGGKINKEKGEKQKNRKAADETPKKKSTKDGGEGEVKRRRGRRRVSGGGGSGGGYKIYVYRVMKQVHPEMGISGKAMTVLNNFMSDMFERLAEEAARLSRYSEKTTLSSREVQGAVQLVLPGELGRHAMAEGAKAVSNYISNTSSGSKS